MTRRTFLASAAAAPAEDRAWRLVLDERFADAGFRGRWFEEGEADLDVRGENGIRFLRIGTKQSAAHKNTHHSVLWLRERLSGDVRFVFRARAQKGNGTIFYMNARTAPGSVYRSIFDWKRPDAVEDRYSACADFEAYTLGYLRAPELNLRHVGGVTAAAWPRQWKPEEVKRYEQESIILSPAAPFGDRVEEWHDFDLRIVGARLSASVDGKPLYDFTDEGRTPRGTIRWTPLTGGGWTGFRNFQATWVDLEFVRIYLGGPK